MIKRETPVNLLTGKYKGHYAVFICWTEKYSLSSKRRAQIRVQTGLGWKTLLINECNFEEVDV